ncbi:nucleotidyltransferase domain-containing protein [Candidatus Aminicenantes bacterium AC-708-M15]|nr:nucleotidyltransferase domain-containing protein [SCandidatus Aminicenantes bacterium Aminicenantia_JdfR_composite]MCP2596501.1 nucleotidyltransferase domain-containing protein [Candidatus Aminicenantes bacterium AC-335-G13]MCP2603898.1 nucleotidyltransferase domain-containing protein [Candidatus Aminicenantes bacterium AC-708-M15]MCP2605710.1 nucleotidyltransferase domain-containing protein [Candidatus Aminicenantes bacterium AC-335-O07]MCP2618095.1 nucleotidyltransferase domain-containing 
MNEKLRIAKKIIKEEAKKRGIKVLKIILFGSRTGKNFNKNSDWDFLVVIDKELNFHEKWEVILSIKRKLLESEIPNDIILKSKESYEIDKEIVNTISYSAKLEGIEI